MSPRRRGMPPKLSSSPPLMGLVDLLAQTDLEKVAVVIYTLLAALGILLYAVSLNEKRRKRRAVVVEQLGDVKETAEEEMRRRMEGEIVKLWKSEPWKREFVGEWDMIEGSRRGFYEYVLFSGKSESAARTADAKPFGNIIRVQVVDDITLALDQNVMRIDTTGLSATNVSEGPWVTVGRDTPSEVQAENKINLEAVYWDEDSRALVRTRDCPEGGFSWTQTRTIDRGIMRLIVIYTKTADSSSATFTCVLHKIF